ncbi:MAG: hypothetical protein K6F09_01475 [Clostridiales bacterium]|nr:hypothetical protein [Clostridiales bacterium]
MSDRYVSGSGDGNDEIDRILAEVNKQNMERSAYDNDTLAPRKQWTDSEINRLLGKDDPTAGISDYDFPEPEDLTYVPEVVDDLSFNVPKDSSEPETVTPDEKSETSDEPREAIPVFTVEETDDTSAENIDISADETATEVPFEVQGNEEPTDIFSSERPSEKAPEQAVKRERGFFGKKPVRQEQQPFTTNQLRASGLGKSTDPSRAATPRTTHIPQPTEDVRQSLNSDATKTFRPIRPGQSRAPQGRQGVRGNRPDRIGAGQRSAVLNTAGSQNKKTSPDVTEDVDIYSDSSIARKFENMRENAGRDGKRKGPRTVKLQTDGENLFPVYDGEMHNEQRERFMRKVEYKHPDEDYDPKTDKTPIEEPGVIVKEGKTDEKTGLVEVPQIRFADNMLRDAKEGKTIVAETKEPKPAPKEKESEMVDGQITLRGFSFSDDVEKVDEKQVEGELSSKRQEKAKNFRIMKFASEYETDLPKPYEDEEEKDEETGPGEGEEGNNAEPTEYTHPSERMKIGHSLLKTRRSLMISTLGVGVIDLILIILSQVAKNSMNADVIFAVSTFLLSGAAALCINSVIAGFKALFTGKPNEDSAVSIVLAFAFIHSILAFIFSSSLGEASIYCAASVFLLLLSRASKILANSATLKNFKFCAFKDSESIYGIQNFDDKNTSFEIGRSLLLGDPELRYSCRAKFPSDFIKYSNLQNPTEKVAKLLIPAAAGISFIVAIIGWIKSDGVLMSAFTSFVGALCISMPACASLAVTLPFFIESGKLTQSGGMIASPGAAAICSSANAVVINSADLYDGDHCKMFGFKDYKATNIKDILLYAAAMVIGSGGPLTTEFEKIIEHSNILLPPVKSLKYEEKLGLTAWIRGQRVLLGNRNLLINHSIETPPKGAEQKYTETGKRVLYMAIENRLAIMLVVGYAENESLRPYLRRLIEDGKNILVSVTDCNITEEFINEGFGLPPGCVKIISPTAAAMFGDEIKKIKQSVPATAIHDGKPESFLRCVSAATSVKNIANTAALFEMIGAALGLLLFIILLLAVGLSGVGSLTVILFTLLWTAVAAGFGIVRNLKR